MPPPDADQAIVNLCAFTDEVILTSTPMHYRDPTHTNIHPQEYWTELFARQGFIRDVDYDGIVLLAHSPSMVGGPYAQAAYAFGYMRALLNRAEAEHRAGERPSRGT